MTITKNARGVQGHWNHPYNRPWATADEDVKDQLARMVGRLNP
jgi:hypothetical protein